LKTLQVQPGSAPWRTSAFYTRWLEGLVKNGYHFRNFLDLHRPEVVPTSGGVWGKTVEEWTRRREVARARRFGIVEGLAKHLA
jgi:hypothetical protein